MKNRPTFESHEDFNFDPKKIGHLSRQEYIRFVRESHEHMRKLSKIIQQYDQTINIYLNEWTGTIDEYVKEIVDYLNELDVTINDYSNELDRLDRIQNEFVENELSRESAETERVLNEEARISKDSERDSKIDAIVNDKADKVQDDWTTPTLSGGATGVIKYRLNSIGLLELQGDVVITTYGATIFTLPTGYRPNRSITDVVNKGGLSSGSAKMLIGTSGIVQIHGTEGTYNVDKIYRLN